MDIAQFLNPKTIAIYGVSEDPKKISSQIYFNIIHNNFKGQVFPINPKYDIVHNVKCYKSINELASLTREDVLQSRTGGLNERKIDLVVIATPAITIPQILEEIGKSGTKNVVIVSAGFKEIGKVGIELENKISELKNKYNLNILGPNCLGFINNTVNLNATFSSVQPSIGNVAFASQSGAVGTSFMDICDERGLGLSYFVSLGNKVGLNENDLLEFLLNDEKTSIVAFYLESFTSGLDFVNIIQRYYSTNAGKLLKSIVLIHPGSSEKAKTAVSSHTGSLVKSWDIIESALQKYGVTTVSNIETFVNVITLLSWNLDNAVNIASMQVEESLLDNFTIVTNAGGPGIILTDLLSNNGFSLNKLNYQTLEKLNNSEILKNKGCSYTNPIDVVGDAKVDRYKEVLEIILNDTKVQNVVIILTPQSSTEIKETSELVINLKSKYKNKLIIPLFAGGTHIKQAREEFYKNRIMNFKYDDDLVDTLIALKSWTNLRNDFEVTNFSFKPTHNSNRFEEGILPEFEVLKLCEKYKISIPKSFLFDNVEKINVVIDQIDFPIILKATSKDSLHKTENNLVETAINKIELQNKFLQLQSKIRKLRFEDERKNGNFVVEFNNYFPEILMQQMLPKSLELFIGIKRDGDSQVYETKNGFGHMLIFGTGGIYAEIYNDLAKVLLPIGETELEKMINKTKVGKILNGARGKTFTTDSLLNLILNLQNLILEHPEIAELDINPIMISENFAKVIDMKILVKY